MRTKTLLIATAAVLAVGIISSQAQAVYSQNIVGYVNASVPAGFTLLSNPLDTQDKTGAINNAATNVFSNPFNGSSGPLDGDQLLIWTGLSYKTYVFDSNPGDTTTGFTDVPGNPLPCPILGPGVGFYINNNNSSITNTIVGSVRGVTSTGSGTTISNTVVIPNQAFNLVGSATPLGGNVLTNLLLANPFNGSSGPLDGCQILIPKFSNFGLLTGYTTYVFDSNPGDTTTGFTDVPGNQIPAPTVITGSGFFFVNNVNAPVNWNQVLNF